MHLLAAKRATYQTELLTHKKSKRLFLIALVVAWLLHGIAASTAFAAAPEKKIFDVPAGDAVVALKRFAEQAGRQVVYMVDTVRGERTNAIKGEYTARDALDRMLANTRLVAVEDQQTTALSIRRNAASSGKTPPKTSATPKAHEARLTRTVAQVPTKVI